MHASALVAGLALWLGGSSSALAHDRPARAARVSPPPASALDATNTFRVDEEHTRAVGEGCEYHASVHGTVRVMASQTTPETQGSHVQPDLWVRSEVRCPDRAPVSTDTRRITRPQASPQDLADEITRRATIQVRRHGVVCSYAPDFAFVRNEFAPGAVAVSCISPAPRGGGPARQR